MSSPTLSRRDFFNRFLRMAPEADSEAPAIPDTRPKVAIIQGRHCLAYQNNMCSVCSERCPEPGAIITERGIPRIIVDLCTGCGICQDLCPAPTNGILLTIKK